jgi:hypothetical protein
MYACIDSTISFLELLGNALALKEDCAYKLEGVISIATTWLVYVGFSRPHERDTLFRIVAVQVIRKKQRATTTAIRMIVR